MNESTESEEGRKERVDRELIELLNELRVGLPGVQIIFGFLLTVPFSQRFTSVDADQRVTFFVILAALSVASLLLISPAAQHRVLFRQADKEGLLQRSNRYARGGLSMLLIALALALFFVLDAVYTGPLAVAVALATLLLGAWWWWIEPLRHHG